MEKTNNTEFKRRMIDRTWKFSTATAKLVENISGGAAVRVIANQLAKSAMSVGANYRSCCKGKSTADFAAKITIVEKEADESAYWLEMLVELGKISVVEADPLIKEAYEFAAICGSAAYNSKKRV